MTGQGNGQPIKYKLDMSEVVAVEIQKIIEEAYVKGTGAKVNRALKTVFDRVRNDPIQFGALFKKHENLNLLIHIAVIYPVAVYFAINQLKKFVIIQRVFLVTDVEEG